MTATSRMSAVALAAILLGTSAAGADPATLLGVTKDWSAFTSGAGSSKTCYALSKPVSTAPKKKRDPIYFLITDWPGRHVKAEPEAVPGYQYKEGTTVTATVGGASFNMFVKNDNGAGAAWVRERADEARLIDAMKGGAHARHHRHVSARHDDQGHLLAGRPVRRAGQDPFGVRDVTGRPI